MRETHGNKSGPVIGLVREARPSGSFRGRVGKAEKLLVNRENQQLHDRRQENKLVCCLHAGESGIID